VDKSGKVSEGASYCKISKTKFKPKTHNNNKMNLAKIIKCELGGGAKLVSFPRRKRSVSTKCVP